MPRRKFIDKKTATTFSLVYRAQNDPKIHDADASDMVLAEKHSGNQSKIKHQDDLKEEFSSGMRDNEGEAANHGVFFDDTEYDYMQHIREMGTGSGAVYIEAPSPSSKGAVKGKMNLEDAIRGLDLQSESGVSTNSSIRSHTQFLLPEEMLPSEVVRRRTYQDQQDVPDAIAGFQPDLDPRVREVLEALDDDAYVEDDEDTFEALAREAEEIDSVEWEASRWDDAHLQDDEGWESDRTIKAEKRVSHDTVIAKSSAFAVTSELPVADNLEVGNWMAEYSKFKKDTRIGPAQKRSDLQSSVLPGVSALAGGRKKKRKGALTSSEGYSMSSSVLPRTEGQSILDARFDKIEEDYEEDKGLDDGASMISGISGFTGLSTTSSEAPRLVRADFYSAMEEFLGTHSQVGKGRVRKMKPQTGLEQLEELRKGLGPARVNSERAESIDNTVRVKTEA